MGLGKFGLGSVVSMMGGNAFNSPAAVFEGIVSISSNVAGSYSMGSVHGNLSTATAGMVKAYTNSDFNAYTSYVNDCYAEVDEPIAELSTLALEVRDLVGVIKIVDRGTPEQKKKVQEENKLLKGLREARLIFLRFYYPGLSPEQLENIAKYYFEPLPEKEPTPAEEAKPKEVVVSASAADGFVTTEFGKELAAEAQKKAEEESPFSVRVIFQVFKAKGIELKGHKASDVAEGLAACDRFVECKDSKPEQLPTLTPGAVVVWAAQEGCPYGAVTIALGEGKEASNTVRAQRTKCSDTYRLFLPK